MNRKQRHPKNHVHHRRTMSEASPSAIAALLESVHLLPPDHRQCTIAAAAAATTVESSTASIASDDHQNDDDNDDQKISSTSVSSSSPSLRSLSSSSSSTRPHQREYIGRSGGRRFSDAMQYRLLQHHQRQTRLETEIEKKRRQHAQWKRYREHRDRVVRELTQRSDSSMQCSCHCALFVCHEQDPFETVTPQEYTCFVDVCCNGNVNPLSPAQMRDIRANEPLSRIVLSISEHVWAILVRLQATLVQGRRQRASEKWMQMAVDRSRRTLMKLQSRMMHDHWNRQGQGQERRQMHNIQYWFNQGSSDKRRCCCMDGMGSGEEEAPCKDCSQQSLQSNAAAESAGSDLQSQSGSEEEFLINRCIEKWLFEHLHPVAFQITEQDAIRDDDLRNRLTTFRNFIEPLHLGLKAELSQHPDFTTAVICKLQYNAMQCNAL